MKIFTNKNIIQKIVIAFVLVMMLNFCLAPNVHASFGGKLMGYIRDFATALADVVISVVQLGVTGEWIYAVDDKGTGTTDSDVDYWIKDSKFQYPIIQISPELIFANEIEVLDADFIGGTVGKTYALESDSSALEAVRQVIASWYVTLRTIAIVGLLSVLIYIGIRIIISSTSQERAKYKQRLIDWIIAFCLLFFMHYIMALTVNVIDQINDMLAGDLVTEGISLPTSMGTVIYEPGGEIRQDDDVYYDVENQYTVDTVSYRIINDFQCIYSDYYYSTSIYSIVWIASNLGGAAYEYSEEGSDYVIYVETIEGAIDPNLDYVRFEIRLTTADYNGKTYVTGGTARVLEGSSSTVNLDSINEYLDELQENMAYSGIYVVDDPITEEESTGGSTLLVIPKSTEDGSQATVRVLANSVNGDGSKILYFINYARLFLNVVDDDEYIPMSVGYLIIYIVLIVFTVMFTIRYMKRVIYIAFLTLIAPLVALTYPIDKIKDRKSTSI